MDGIAPTALALVHQIAVADGTPPTDEDQIAELLVLPGADDMAVPATRQIIVPEGCVDEEFHLVADCELFVAVAEHLARARLGGAG